MLSKIDLIGEKELKEMVNYFKRKKWKYFVFQ